MLISKKRYKNFKLTLKNNLNENMLEENSRFSHFCSKMCRNSKKNLFQLYYYQLSQES